MNCASWNPVNLYKHKKYNQNERKKLNEVENLREKMNYYKNSNMNDPFKELSFFISPGLKYLGMN